ncbi:hypothetical protein ACIBL3_32110 [Kribbella sp. NPDC050124]
MNDAQLARRSVLVAPATSKLEDTEVRPPEHVDGFVKALVRMD